jgi:hypothetical protein
LGYLQLKVRICYQEPQSKFEFCRSLGFTIEDASIVNTAVPLADVIAPPAAGFLADKIGNFRVFMSVLTFLNGVSSLFLLTVNEIETSSKESNFSLMCCTRKNMSLCYLENNDYYSVNQRDFTGNLKSSLFNMFPRAHFKTNWLLQIQQTKHLEAISRASTGMDLLRLKFSHPGI